MRVPRPASTRSGTPRRRTGLLTLALAVVAGAALVGGAGPAATPTAEAATAECAPVDIYFNSASPVGLYRYSPYGSVTSMPLDNVFLDITFNADGSRLFGLTGAGLVEIDPQTGQTLPDFSIPGAGGNGLAQLADGRLLLAGGSQLSIIDLDAGTVTPDPVRHLPEGQVSSGDLLVLPDGDVLAVTSGLYNDALVRISPEGVETVLGSVPSSYGISASGDAYYLTATNGTIYRLDSVPTTAGSEPLPVTEVASTGTLPYGATSINESKPCNTVFSAAPSDGSTPYGEPPQLIAYGYPAGTQGTVTFTTGDSTLCSVELTDAEDARCQVETLPPGRYPVTATLSTGETALTSFVVEPFATAVEASVDPGSVPYGQPATLTISNLPANATGSVQVYGSGGDEDWYICQIDLPATSCTTPTYLPGGSYQVSVYYSGDTTYAASQTETSFRVTGGPTGDPSGQPTGQPSGQPSGTPTGEPSGTTGPQPSTEPTGQPSTEPSGQPEPSDSPTGEPSDSPSTSPSDSPTSEPSTSPSAEPSVDTTSDTTTYPTPGSGEATAVVSQPVPPVVTDPAPSRPTSVRSTLASTGGPTLVAAVAGLLSLVAGAGVLLARRRRPRS